MLRYFVSTLLLCLTAFLATPGLAFVPTRGSSRNGINSSAANWNLFAPNAPVTLTANGKKVIYTRQIVCTNQTVTNAKTPPLAASDWPNTGACEDGQYTFLYQLQSTSTNVTVRFARVTGFTANASTPTYGVAVCDGNNPTDPVSNTFQLCTTTSSSAQIPNITFTSTSSTGFNFVIPNFPAFPAGVGTQGKGLTLVFLTKQSKPLPIAFPFIGIV